MTPVTVAGEGSVGGLAVPGLHSSAPLYHKLQQYSGDSGKWSEGKRERRVRECVNGGDGEGEDPLPRLPQHSSSPVSTSVESPSTEVR